MTDNIERRLLDGHLTTAGRKLVGHAAKFSTPARIGSVTETIAPGAFRRSLVNGADIRAFIDHDQTRILGRTKSGTLRLTEDEIGLRFELDVPDTQPGRDILALAERNDLSGMSFGFRVASSGERWNSARTQRTLNDVELIEISIISGGFPAYEGTTVSARSGGLVAQSAFARRAVALKLRGQA